MERQRARCNLGGRTAAVFEGAMYIEVLVVPTSAPWASAPQRMGDDAASQMTFQSASHFPPIISPLHRVVAFICQERVELNHTALSILYSRGSPIPLPASKCTNSEYCRIHPCCHCNLMRWRLTSPRVSRTALGFFSLIYADDAHLYFA